MSEDDALSVLARSGTATIGEVNGATKILDQAIRPLERGTAVCGRAFTVRCTPGDNLAIHHAVPLLSPGDILVVDYGGSLRSGPFGEVLAVACQSSGAVGLVIDGAVRDAAALAVRRFPVMCRGLAIPGTTKNDPGVIGQPVVVGGVKVEPGDVVVADDDAVVSFPAADLLETAAKAATRVAYERDVMARLECGETTSEILGLAKAENAT
ncbi:MAG: RraA family protein [Pseudomonadota bacterium]